MKKFSIKIIILLIAGLVLKIDSLKSEETFTISGYVKDANTGEDLIGASIYVAEHKAGTQSNSYGFFSLSLPKGNYHIQVSFLGYHSQDFQINLNESVSRNFQMVPNDLKISEVSIIAEKKDKNIKSTEMSVNKLQIKTIMKIPALMGEVDILRSIQMLPGVKTVGEGSVGFYVRGGGVDQNLILLDEATVYNASHLGGLFSVFNQDVVKDVKLLKGGIPAMYGGRLSSILEINMKDGNKKKLSLTGGIGLISSRLTIEGPIVKDKSSFIVSGRRTYADLFFPFLKDSVIKKSKAYFYDFNAKVNFQLNDKNRLFFSGYFGHDVMKIGDDIRIDYGNKTFTARYNHLFSTKIFSNLSFIYSFFDYGMGVPQGTQAFDWQSGINDVSLKNDYTWYINTKNTFSFGVQLSHHTFEPGKALPVGNESIFTGINLPHSFALEYGIFADNEQRINDKISLAYGIRFSGFQNLGPYTSYIYDKSNPQDYKVVDSLVYKDNELFNQQKAFEPRFSINFLINSKSSVKLSYNRMAQYIHLTTNTMSSTPLDLWFPSSPNVKPEKADQVALGYFRNFMNDTYEASFETYYKKMYNTIDYVDHAEVLLNKYLEGELRFGDAYSYGFEFLLRKQSGKFTGWLSYTYSRVFREIPEINYGNEYPANYDKPNDISLILSYDIFENLNFSVTWLYSTGAPRTMPTERFESGGMIVPVYSNRNGVRLPDYHRMDIGVTYNFKKTRENGEPKKFLSSVNLSVYNVYNRHNAYSITFNQIENQSYETEAIKTYLFKVFPSITYNFHF